MLGDSFGNSVADVLMVIGLIAATSIILILVVDLILSIVNPRGSIFFGRRKRRQYKEEHEKEVQFEESNSSFKHEDPKNKANLPTLADESEFDGAPMRQTWDEAEAKKEESDLFASKPMDSRDQEIEQRNQQFSSYDSDDDEEFDFDAMIKEINKEAVTTFNEERHQKEIENTLPNVDDMLDDDKFDELFAEVQADEKKKKGITVKPEHVTLEPDTGEGAPEPIEATGPIVNVYGLFTEEALNARLEKLKQRLRVNERDLRGNRKEYSPLARVKRNLERDQQKLRRKEAVLARNKVVLYGVNNYADVNESKAKELSEDLELLDALRLSVKQCEEIMEKNKDRFPILERANRILKEQNKQIKEDIAEVKFALEKFKNGNA